MVVEVSPTRVAVRSSDLPRPRSADELPDIEGLRVHLVGINYAPEPTGIGPYTTGMAEHLAAAGAQVTAVAGMAHYPTWALSASDRRRLWTRDTVNGVDLLRLRHTVPATMTAARRAIYEATFLAHAVARTTVGRPDVVLAVSPALGGAVAGALLARRTKRPLVTVVQDLMAKASGESGITGGGKVVRVTEAVEGYALRRADRVFVVSDAFREGVESYGVPAENVGLLRNWTHITTTDATRDEARALLGWDRDEFLAVHTGNMGFKQDLGNVVEAARQLRPEERTALVLVGDGSLRRELQEQGRGVQALRFVDPVDDATYPLVLAAADVLVVNERASVADMSLPSKLTSYLAARRPVVAAVARGGATYRELSYARAAFTVPAGDPARLADAVRQLRESPARCEDLAAAGHAYAREHLTPAASLAVLHRALADVTGR